MGKITKRSSVGVRRGSGTVNATNVGAELPDIDASMGGIFARISRSRGDFAAFSAGLVVGVLRPRDTRLALWGREEGCDTFVSFTTDCTGASGAITSDIVFFCEKTCAMLIRWGIPLEVVATTIFYLTISQMSIPPWILALIILIMVAGLGASRLAAKYGLPDGFMNNGGSASHEGFVSGAERQRQGTNASEGFALGNSPMLSPSFGDSRSEGFAPMSSRQIIVPSLALPNNIPGNYVIQAYGIHDRSIHPGSVRGDGVKEPFIAEVKQKLYPGVDHNITTAQQSVPYSGVLSEDTNSPLTQQLAVVQAVAKGNIPTEQNLEMINGGSGDAANVKLSQGYQAHQEKIYPDQHPRPQHSQLTAGAPTDSGTIAEDIQKESVRTPSVREMVREEEHHESESFNNPYAVRYQSI